MKKIRKQTITNKTRILTSLLLLSLTLLFCLTTVSAAPGDTIYVNTGGNDSWDGQSAAYNDTTKSGPKLSIKNATGVVNTNGTINIANGQYTGQNNTNITINKNMNIIGESQTGTIINGTGTNWIFTINSGATVTLTNLTLTNATGSDGGVIYNKGNLTATNCTFTNNNATNSGGAIYNIGTSSLSGCSFNNNTATNVGGAINNGGTMTLSGCNFKNNNATWGGAIFNGNSATIRSLSNCNFINNTATYGGAIRNNGGTTTSLSNCNFNNNTATYGGAINNGNVGIITLSDCNFNNNTATHDGGAIHNDNRGTITLSDCNFNNNTAKVGGAIINGDTITNGGTITSLSGCNFTNNTATNDGGAIHNIGTLTLSGCNFKNNNATWGGAIFNGNSATIRSLSNCNFINNTAKVGGAIINGDTITNGGTITSLSGCNFTNNTAESGGAIVNGNTIASLSSCNFTNNTATADTYGGGAIYNNGNITGLNGCNFTNNKATTYGGAIYNEGSLTAQYNRFYNNTATSGTAIYCSTGSVNATFNWWGSNKDPKSIDKLIYDPNKLVNTTNWVILTVNANPTIINNTQTSVITADLNHYTDSSGNIGTLTGHIPDGINVIYSSTLGSVSSGSEITNNGQTQTTFTPNCYSGLATVHTTVDGFSLDTPITITNSNIYVSNNTGSDTTGDGSQYNPYQTIKKGISTLTAGGTIHIANGQYTGQNNTLITIDKNMNIIGESQSGTIINGTGTNRIFTINSGATITLTNLTLTNATSTARGAIYNQGTLTATNCTFTNNTVTITYINIGGGGAIYNKGTIISLSGCTFTNNNASYDGSYNIGGGAIYNQGTINSLIDCNFTKNTATHCGGAICNWNNIISLSGCIFTNNTATNDGYGGAIYNYEGTITSLNGCNFTNNTATTNGGAICNTQGNITSISSCNFTSNNATNGGAIRNWDGNLTAQYNRFYNNTATTYGTAIYCYSGSVNATLNWWGSNSPQDITNLIVAGVGGSVNASTWVILTINANPTTIYNTQTTIITSDLNHYTDSGGNIGTLTEHIPDVDVIFAVDANGNLDSLNGVISNGQNAATTFTATKIGLATVNATVDGFTVDRRITLLNNAPTVTDESETTDEDTSATGQITAADADGDTLTYTKATNPTNGTATVNSATGTYIYTPKPNYNGPDSFTVTVNDDNGGFATSTVTITVNPINDAPVAVNDGATTNEDNSVDVDVLANDTDVDTGDSLSINIFTQPGNGTTSLVGGKIRYTPNPNWYGTDTFTYTTHDNSGAISNIATVTITVNPVNDAPTVDNYSSTTQEDTLTSGTVIGSDVDSILTYSLRTHASNGTAVVNPDGTWTYTPKPNYNGPDSFTVTVSDGTLTATSTITITINPVNDIPVANNDSKIIDEDNTATGQITAIDDDGDTLIYTKDTNPAHGTVTVNSNGTYIYTPNNNWHGTDNFTVLVSDGNGGTAVSTVTITVNSVNDIPVAQNDTTTTKEGKSININVLGNDSDADGDSLTVTNVTQPNHGTAAINTDGTITYTPNNNWYGTDSFTYTVSDGNGGTTTATVTITVNQAVSNLYIKTTTSSPNPTVGETFTLTYKLGNKGPDAAENVIITFQIPEGLDFINIHVDNGKYTYNETTRTVTWTLDSVPVGDPYLYLTVKAEGDGTYKIIPSTTSATYNLHSGDSGIITINVQTNSNNNNNGNSNNENTVNAATKTTIGLQKTGLPLNYLILAILMVLSGLIPKRK